MNVTLTEDFFVAPDGEEEPSLWRRTDGEPVLILRRCDLPSGERSLVWQAIEGVVPAAPDEEPKPCEAEVRHGSYFDPPELCPEDAEPGSDYCTYHREDYEA